MAIPLILAPAVAGVVSGISMFLASRGAWILAGLGIAMATVTGLTAVGGIIIGDMQLLIGGVQSIGSGVGPGGAYDLGVVAMKMAAYVGLFDALNILIGGFMASYGLVALRVVMRRLS